MALETGTYISDLVATNPTGADDRSTADDHLRLIKATIKNTFPNINNAMNCTDEELNIFASAGKTGFSSTDNIIDSHPAGTLSLFQQTAAPTGWTKQTAHDNKALRVVTGTAGSGGNINFTTTFARTATDSHALTVAQMPAHNHGSAGNHSHTGTASDNSGSSYGFVGALGDNSYGGTSTNGAHTHNTEGSNSGHTHNMDIRVQYVDVIIASKN